MAGFTITVSKANGVVEADIPAGAQSLGIDFYEPPSGYQTLAFGGYFGAESLGDRYSSSAEDFYNGVVTANRSDPPPTEGSFIAILICTLTGNVAVYTDPFGTRPIYYRRAAGTVCISTDILSLIKCLDEKILLDRNGLEETALFGFSLPGGSLFQGVVKCDSNAVTTIAIDGDVDTHHLEAKLVYDAEGHLDLPDAVDCVGQVLTGDFHRIGALYHSAAVLLSGGIDSSILASYATQTFQRVVAYSCEIEGYHNPELVRAKHVARVLGIEHKVLRLPQSQMPALFEEVCELMGEPTRHINNMVTRFLLKNIDDVDIIVGGDGADALFGTAYQKSVVTFHRRSGYLKFTPRFLKSATCRLMAGISRRKADTLEALFFQSTETYAINKYAVDFGRWDRGFLDKYGLAAKVYTCNIPTQSATVVGRAIEINAHCFLPCMLQRNSKLSGGMGIPIYYPFLSDEMIKVSKKMPDSLRFDAAGNTKKPIIELCRRVVDDTTADWPKIGFTTPEREWLDNQLAPYAREVLNSKMSKLHDYGIRIDEEDRKRLTRSARLLWWLMGLNRVLMLAERS